MCVFGKFLSVCFVLWVNYSICCLFLNKLPKETNLASQISQPPFSYYLFLLIICEYKQIVQWCKKSFQGQIETSCAIIFYAQMNFAFNCFLHALYCVSCLAQFCVIYRKGHFETYFFFILYVQMNFVFNCFNSCIVYCGACLAESELKQVVGSDSLPHPCPP